MTIQFDAYDGWLLHFSEDYSHGMLKLLSTAYSTVSVVDAAAFLGLSENDVVTCKPSLPPCAHIGLQLRSTCSLLVGCKIQYSST